MKKILVTGSTGFVGKSLVKDLLKENKDIYAIIRKNSKNVRLAKKIKKEFKNYFPVFFTDNQQLKNKIIRINPDVIVNLATYFLSNPKHEQLSSVMNSNIIFPTLVLDSSCNLNIKKFINLCSVAQFSKNRIDNPQNFYALTKIMFKKCVDFYKKMNPKINFLNVYIGDTYGSSDRRKKIFPTLVYNYKKNKRTVIISKKLKLNVVHVKDLVSALKILINNIKNSDEYIVKAKKNILLYKLINEFNKKNKKKIKVLWLNKSIDTLNKIKMKKIPKWKERFDVSKFFYRDLNESN